MARAHRLPAADLERLRHRQNWCTITVDNSDHEIYMTVTLTQGTASETLDSYGFINEYCGSMPC